MSEIGSELSINTPGLSQWSHSGILIVNFEQILHSGFVFSLVTLDM